MKGNLSLLSSEQQEQVLLQWQKHQHPKNTIDIELSGHNDKLKGFIIEKGVWDPGVTSAQYHASYLYYNNERLFAGKRVLDMGAGSGIAGIVTVICGAREVVLSDISRPSVRNAARNIKKLKLEDKARVIQGDLFENITGRFDFIVFNHPFFCGEPEKGDTIAASMLAPESLIKRFLQEAPKYLAPKGVVMMPFYTKAGPANDPAIQGPKYGFTVTKTFRTISNTGLQRGEILIYELKYNIKSKV